LSQLMDKLNFQDWKKINTKELSNIGYWSGTVFVLSIIVTLSMLLLQILLTPSGKRFLSVGIPMIIFGAVLFLISNFGSGASELLSSKLINSSSVIYTVVGVAFPPIILGVLDLWQKISIAEIILGTIFLFVKKPKYNVNK
ncbi:MAG: hypothetical protein GYA60_00940, partial [Candidatus Methanofastidiosa archaeon]|nr:hypothetical protein [Candidatus Methanofastidiosa archaeon]